MSALKGSREVNLLHSASSELAVLLVLAFSLDGRPKSVVFLDKEK